MCVFSKHKTLVIYALALFQLLPLFLFCQNLIPNPSFEEIDFCPTGAGQANLAKPWNQYLTPDLYHTCAESIYYQVPNNSQCNYLPAHHGTGYVGMYVHPSKEVAFARLADTLEAGKYYYARFFVSPDEDCPSSPQTFSDAIGMGVKGSGPNDNFRIVAENIGTVITDTTTWTKVSGCFQAKGDELFVQIGNFRDATETIIISDDTIFPLSQQSNYMFIDDLLLTEFNPFPDTVLMCNGQPLNLDATFYDADFQWTTGDTTPFLLALDTGVYVVNARIDGCVLREEVTVVNFDYSDLTPTDTSICISDNLLLNPNIPGSYQWSNGKKSEKITVSSPDTYVANITNSCGEFQFSQVVENENCRCRIFVPNVFSPNYDGINDELLVNISCDYEYSINRFEVFDRWGNHVFSNSEMPLKNWDGTFKGKLAQPGVYVWYLSYDLVHEGSRREIVEEGGVTIFR